MNHRKRGGSPERKAQGQVPVPAAMLERAAQYGIDPEALHTALEAPAPVSIRLNPARPFGPPGETVPWEPMGRQLPERPSFTMDPAFHTGCYYVQEASSMLLGHAYRAALRQATVQRALDLCAAPGGKSTHLRALLPDEALLVSNEVEAPRRSVLLENLWKWGHPATVVTGSPTQRFAGLGPSFDLVLVDAPCSGEGMMRRDAHARAQWNSGLVEQCALRQHRIIEDAWQCLRPGGILIYSTCTWETAENEAQLLALIRDHGAVPIEVPWPTGAGVRTVMCEGAAIGAICFPHLVQGEGFFIGLVCKPGETQEHIAGRATEPKALPGKLQHWILDPGEAHALWHAETWHALPALHAGFVEDLLHTMNVVSTGIPLATEKAGRYKPHPALAYSTMLRRDAFGHVPLNSEQALSFLAGNSLPGTDAEGDAIATWNGLVLGWLHGAGRRWNNGLPKAWRIRKHIGA